MISKEKAEKLEAELRALEGLDHPALKERFETLYGKRPPKRIGKTLLTLAVAWEMQRKAYGVRTDRLFQRLAKYDVQGKGPSRTRSPAGGDGDRRTGAADQTAAASPDNVLQDGAGPASDSIASKPASHGEGPRRRNPAIKRTVRPGGRLIREWQGRTYEVFVAEDACYVDGRKYASLSAAASAITGVKRNGPAFFGLRSPRVLQP